MGGGAGGGGGCENKFVPVSQHTNAALKSHIFVSFQQINFELDFFIKFKAFFSVVSLACPKQTLKKK